MRKEGGEILYLSINYVSLCSLNLEKDADEALNDSPIHGNSHLFFVLRYYVVLAVDRGRAKRKKPPGKLLLGRA